MPLTDSQQELLVSKGIDPKGMTYLGGGSEGYVFANPRTQTVLKIFKSEFYFNHSLWMEKRLTDSALKAGYKVASSSITDSNHLLIEHKLEGGLTLLQFNREFQHSDRKKWQAAFDQQRILFANFRKLLQQDQSFYDEFQMTGRGYFDKPGGHFTENGKTYYLNMHQENVLITEPSPGKFEFTIIDWH